MGSWRSLDELVEMVQACRRCPAMEGRRRVLSALNGPPAARALFVAEAPGRLGGELSGAPLSGDASGKRFTRLLDIAGLRRDEVFITNTVLCNPRDERGCNRPPSGAERANCSGWLVAQLDLIQAPVVVALGSVALGALDRIEPHGASLRPHVGEPLAWRGRWLVPLYHPSPRAGLSRPYEQQDADFAGLGAFVRRVCPPVAPAVG